MKSRYLIRFDDICPTMNWSVWESVESILLKYHIKPILAVVPDNQDPQLVVDAPRPDFWEKVRQWQSYGPEGQKKLIESIHTRRLGAPEDIASATLFFLSEQAGWISGQVLSVDGGRS